jgi:lipid A 3-O-deacylase
MKRAPLWLAAFAALVPLAPAGASDAFLDEAKLGVLAHDVPIGGDRREGGADVNGELLFASPGFLAPVWAPRPHLGFVANTLGGNSYGYAGLTWQANFSSSLFGALGLGGAVHTGPDISATTDHKGLGTRVLFHEYVELGYRVSGPWSASLFLDHVSNADLGRRNPGLTNLGLRTGYAF